MTSSYTNVLNEVEGADLSEMNVNERRKIVNKVVWNDLKDRLREFVLNLRAGELLFF